MLSDIPTYSVHEFSRQILQLIKGEQESGICNASAILEVSGKLNLLMNLNQVPSIVLGFFNFHFPIDLGSVRGVSRGSVRGQLTGGQCFVEPLVRRRV